ncbi:hypothetical protein pipiens_004288 [Culex pipiens pipiens]|uniref:Uncharacterized protein n=1 Tax=Culex pipiens pipiens TaxID=38569 RepID=A0ABD1CK80_CULPP
MEHVATTPPELHVVQSPQLFPNVNDPRWSNRVPDSYINRPNVGRWSQETGSDNEMHPQNPEASLTIVNNDTDKRNDDEETTV